jgi:hypothetical protein
MQAPESKPAPTTAKKKVGISPKDKEWILNKYPIVPQNKGQYEWNTVSAAAFISLANQQIFGLLCHYFADIRQIENAAMLKGLLQVELAQLKSKRDIYPGTESFDNELKRYEDSLQIPETAITQGAEQNVSESQERREKVEAGYVTNDLTDQELEAQLLQTENKHRVIASLGKYLFITSFYLFYYPTQFSAGVMLLNGRMVLKKVRNQYGFLHQDGQLTSDWSNLPASFQLIILLKALHELELARHLYVEGITWPFQNKAKSEMNKELEYDKYKAKFIELIVAANAKLSAEEREKLYPMLNQIGDIYQQQYTAVLDNSFNDTGLNPNDTDVHFTIEGVLSTPAAKKAAAALPIPASVDEKKAETPATPVAATAPTVAKLTLPNPNAVRRSNPTPVCATIESKSELGFERPEPWTTVSNYVSGFGQSVVAKTRRCGTWVASKLADAAATSDTLGWALTSVLSFDPSPITPLTPTAAEVDLNAAERFLKSEQELFLKQFYKHWNYADYDKLHKKHFNSLKEGLGSWYRMRQPLSNYIGIMRADWTAPSKPLFREISAGILPSDQASDAFVHFFTYSWYFVSPAWKSTQAVVLESPDSVATANLALSELPSHLQHHFAFQHAFMAFYSKALRANSAELKSDPNQEQLKQLLNVLFSRLTNLPSIEPESFKIASTRHLVEHTLGMMERAIATLDTSTPTSPYVEALKKHRDALKQNKLAAEFINTHDIYKLVEINDPTEKESILNYLMLIPNLKVFEDNFLALFTKIPTEKDILEDDMDVSPSSDTAIQKTDQNQRKFIICLTLLKTLEAQRKELEDLRERNYCLKETKTRITEKLQTLATLKKEATQHLLQFAGHHSSPTTESTMIMTPTLFDQKKKVLVEEVTKISWKSFKQAVLLFLATCKELFKLLRTEDQQGKQESTQYYKKAKDAVLFKGIVDKNAARTVHLVRQLQKGVTASAA